MLGSYRLGTITEVWCLTTKVRDGCVCTVCWLSALLKLKLVLCLGLYKEYGMQG